MPTADDVKRSVLAHGSGGYTFCNNNPVNFVDPHGCQPVPIGGVLPGLAAVAAPPATFGSNLSVAKLGAKDETDDNAGTNKNWYIFREYQFTPSGRGASVVWQEVEFDFLYFDKAGARYRFPGGARKFEEFFVIEEDQRIGITPPGGKPIYREHVPTTDWHALPKPGGAHKQKSAVNIPANADYCEFRMVFKAFEVMDLLENGVKVDRSKILVQGGHSEAGTKYSYRNPLKDSVWTLEVTYYWCRCLGIKPCCKDQRVGLLKPRTDIYVKSP